MVDMTDNKENQKDFITNILLDIDGSNYYVVYADGSVEKNKFDVENYNEVLLQMEREYFDYKESYIQRKRNDRMNNSIKMIITDLITAISAFLVYNIDIDGALRMAMAFMLILTGLLIHQKFSEKIRENNLELEEVYLMDEIVKRKEEFATEITDPETGETKKWYAINLSNIYTIASPSVLKNYTKEENKLKKIPDFLKRNSEYSDVR